MLLRSTLNKGAKLKRSIFKPLQACYLSESSADTGEARQQLYPGHIQTSSFQKLLLTSLSSVIAITDPTRDDMICAMGEASGSFALSRIRQRMLRDSEGRQILLDKPVISKETVDLDYLSKLHETSLGKAYWNFLQINGFDPDARRPVNFVDDVELAYVMLRYRQLHDLTHTILGMKPNMLGEVAVKWFEAIQTGLPMCVSAAIAGPIRLGPKHGQLWRRQLWSWSVKNGYSCKPLMNFYVEKHWETPISELRDHLGLTAPPCNNFM
ncbi:ubiquinone biosynthesis protein COQ4 homolog, mitochondrial-like [Watersipora subatra]|uniref:ubiquinone biosynthesis protein COQ4 homolog, mitochondrial-like n=1 Tax=Watersipora subatra TaxID=2589382 RepID=UPI00355BF38E